MNNSANSKKKKTYRVLSRKIAAKKRRTCAFEEDRPKHRGKAGEAAGRRCPIVSRSAAIFNSRSHLPALIIFLTDTQVLFHILTRKRTSKA